MAIRSRKPTSPGRRFQTTADFAEIWFKTAEDAEAAGFELPPSQRDKEEDES